MRVLGDGVVSGATFGVVFACVGVTQWKILSGSTSCVEGGSIHLSSCEHVDQSWGGWKLSTNLERQSAGLFLAPKIHSNVML